jgi:hypothetical protein
LLVKSFLLLKICFFHGTPAFNFSCTFCTICHHATQIV